MQEPFQVICIRVADQLKNRAQVVSTLANSLPSLVPMAGMHSHRFYSVARFP